MSLYCPPLSVFLFTFWRYCKSLDFARWEATAQQYFNRPMKVSPTSITVLEPHAKGSWRPFDVPTLLFRHHNFL